MNDRASEPAGAPELRRVLDGTVKLLREHVALARAELGTELRRSGGAVSQGLLALPLLALGGLLLQLAALSALAQRWGWPSALLAVALLNLACGVALGAGAARGLTRRPPGLPETAAVLAEDRRLLRELRAAGRAERSPPAPTIARAPPTAPEGSSRPLGAEPAPSRPR